MLKVSSEVIHRLIESGQLRAYRIGSELRIGESDLAKYLDLAVVNASPAPAGEGTAAAREGKWVAAEVDRHKECPTFGGQSTFSYSGSVATGTTIWPSKKANYKLRFDATQWALLLQTFGGKEVRAGLNFSVPEAGSFGHWIKEHWNTKMGPAAYVGGILIAEGYACRPRPGWIRLFAQEQNTNHQNSYEHNNSRAAKGTN